MEELDAFLERHVARLERHLEGFAPHYRVTADFVDYVEEVLDDWAGVGPEALRCPYRPGEKVFWYLLYQLEELAELPRGWDEDPYVVSMRASLPDLRERLGQRAPLPACFGAARPGAYDFMPGDSGAAPDMDELDALDFGGEDALPP